MVDKSDIKAFIVALLAWSVYGFFGERAAKVHKGKANMAFEAAAFIFLAAIAAI